MTICSNRITSLKKEVQASRPSICTERALIRTEYFRSPENKNKPACIQIAEALRDVLLKKTLRVYPNELIVGNFNAKRVGGQIQPELLGVAAMQDILKRRELFQPQVLPAYSSR